MTGRARLKLAAALVTCALAVTAGWAYRAGTTRLRIVVSEELRDTAALLQRFGDASGIDVIVRYRPSRALVEQLAAGAFDGHADAVFLPQVGPGGLPQEAERRLERGHVIMTSPVALGLRPGVRDRLTATGPPAASGDGTAPVAAPSAAPAPPGSAGAGGTTWQQVADAVGRGQLRFGMVEPRPLGTAEAARPDLDEADAALLTIATGLAQAPGALITHEAYRISPDLRTLRRGQALRPASASDLVDRVRTGAEPVDAVVAGEADLLRINERLRPPLEIQVPGGRAVSTRYLLRPLIASASPVAHESVAKLVGFLGTTESRAWLAGNTHRRPAAAGEAGFPAVRELEIPRSAEVLAEVTGAYLDEVHYPTRVVFALDVSGSMRGKGIADLRAAFASLTGTVATEHGQDVQVLLLPFASEPGPIKPVEVAAADPGRGLREVASYVAGLQPGGGTALYAALARADREIADQTARGREHVTAIILITDGRNTAAMSLADFRDQRAAMTTRRCTPRSRERCQAPVFPVLAGAADEPAMRELADLTGGSVRDARNADLGQVLRDLTAGH